MNFVRQYINQDYLTLRVSLFRNHLSRSWPVNVIKVKSKLDQRDPGNTMTI